MIVLDTDHLSVLQAKAGGRFARLTARMDASADTDFGAPIVAAEESMRGWLASIAKEKDPRRQVLAYRELAGLFAFYAGFRIVLFDPTAAGRYDGLRSVRIKAMDRKIAAIALATDALLLTANRQDFEKVPGLRFENWMDA